MSRTTPVMSPFHFAIPLQNQEELACTRYGPLDTPDQPLVIYVHGFKGFKDWAFVPTLGAYLAQHGLSMLAFNFSHNGIGPDGETFTALDKFERNTFTRELDELSAVIESVRTTDVAGAATRRIGLLGHSRGGGIALLAAQLPIVTAVCTWAAVSTFERYDQALRTQWRKKGYTEVRNSRTGQVFKLGLSLLQDVERHSKTRLNILQAVQQLSKPLLILHGAADETVPPFEGEQLNIFADPGTTYFRLIPGAGHTFNTKHPYDGSNPAFEEALERSLLFFQENL